MKEIIVKHSSIQITEYTLGECPKLENIFSVFDMITHSYNILGIYYDENTKILYIPRGVDIRYIEKLFDKKAVIDMKHQPYDYTNSPIIFC